MERRILEFAHLLRRHGISVSQTQVADAIRAVAIVGLEREDFYQALRCTLLTDRSRLLTFDRLFHLYFSEPWRHRKPKRALLDGATEEEEERDANGVWPAGFTGGVGTELQGESSPSGPPESLALLLVKAVREGDYASLRSIAEYGVRSLGKLTRGDFARLDALVERAKINIGWYEAVKWLIPNF